MWVIWNSIALGYFIEDNLSFYQCLKVLLYMSLTFKNTDAVLFFICRFKSWEYNKLNESLIIKLNNMVNCSLLLFSRVLLSLRVVLYLSCTPCLDSHWSVQFHCWTERPDTLSAERMVEERQLTENPEQRRYIQQDIYPQYLHWHVGNIWILV